VPAPSSERPDIDRLAEDIRDGLPALPDEDDGTMAFLNLKARLAALDELVALARKTEGLKRWQRAYAKGRAGLVEQADQDFARAEAAEARVAELEQERDSWITTASNCGARVAELEAALRDVRDMCARPAGVCFDPALAGDGDGA
jgi:hypothetical protein